MSLADRLAEYERAMAAAKSIADILAPFTPEMVDEIIREVSRERGISELPPRETMTVFRQKTGVSCRVLVLKALDGGKRSAREIAELIGRDMKNVHSAMTALRISGKVRHAGKNAGKEYLYELTEAGIE